MQTPNYNQQVSDDARRRPMPPTAPTVDTDDYQLVAIDRQAPEHAEELVELASIGIATESFYARNDGLNAPIYRRFISALTGVYARAGVARKLLEVNRILAPYGVELLVWDGFRPVPVQRELWDWFIAEARRLQPEASDEERVRFALRYCSHPDSFDPEDETTWPTHATGGALDLTLREIATGKPLFMGGIYLDPSEVSTTRYYENRSAIWSHEEARRNRRLLYRAMTSVGFVNYPFEWWHFDWLTQAWVMNQGRPEGLKACYGLANRGGAVNR